MMALVIASDMQALTTNLGTVPGVSVMLREMGSMCIIPSEEMWMPAVITESTTSRNDQEPRPTSTLEDFRSFEKHESKVWCPS
mmetsp:Transcript_17417/g.41309  ORF Transcript_17417/g.41309 Transcript_17417/m.41309 type:complete len:83 (+) Transcript_17417:125-373(+)